MHGLELRMRERILDICDRSGQYREKAVGFVHGAIAREASPIFASPLVPSNRGLGSLGTRNDTKQILLFETSPRKCLSAPYIVLIH